MADTLQILVNTGAKPRVTFHADGTPTDLDAGVPTVVATRPDGTTFSPPLVASHVEPAAANPGAYEVVYPPQAEVTLTRLDWTGTIGAVPQTVTTWAEIVGAFLFNLPDLRAVKVAGGTPFTDETAFPNNLLLARRTEVTDDFAERCGWSFVPRFARETHDGRGHCDLVLHHLKASDLLSVTIDGIAQNLADFTLDSSGVLTWEQARFPATRRQNVIVEYVHGWDRPPAAISTAALARAAMLLLPSQAASTVSTWTTPDGTTYSYDQAGQRFQGGGVRHYGVPAIDSVLNDPAYSARGLAVA